MHYISENAKKDSNLESVAGIILAGTYQWTGSSFDALCPRPLLPVVQAPLIEHVLGWLRGAGVPEAIICANGSTSALRRYLGPMQSPLAVDFHEDGSPRGAAGCVKDAAAASAANIFLVTDGASIPTVDVSRLLAHHDATKAALTIVVHERARSLGQSHLEPTGTYVFNREVLDAVPATSFQDIKENLIPKMYREGQRIETFTIGEASPRVLNATSYLTLNRWMIQRMASVDGGCEYAAHPSAVIDETAVIVGPVVIGAGVRVHASATIVGPTCLGAGTVVERAAVVTRSVTWEDCIVGSGAVVDQCLLADNVVVESDTSVSSAVRVYAPEHRAWVYHLLPARRPASSGALVRAALS
jgi:NDP-sugar pyrophosphorylase family protein